MKHWKIALIIGFGVLMIWGQLAMLDREEARLVDIEERIERVEEALGVVDVP